MSDAKLDGSKYATITFDCYGTLIDWENGLLGHLQPLLQSYYINAIDEFVLGLFAELEPAAQSEGGTYREVLRRVMQRMATRLAFTPTDEVLDSLAESIQYWQPFEDAVPVLKALKEHYRLGIVSNVDNDLFADSAELLIVPFDHVITAEDAGAYKPDSAIFERALGEVDSPVLHVAQSRFHDVAPANALGLDTVWINRPSKGATKPFEAEANWTFENLSDLAQALAGN
jgi:2-haloacid dehalogenase